MTGCVILRIKQIFKGDKPWVKATLFMPEHGIYEYADEEIEKMLRVSDKHSSVLMTLAVLNYHLEQGYGLAGNIVRSSEDKEESVDFYLNIPGGKCFPFEEE